ncbi:hypothetical protein FRB95_000469 [Tulasnella sp. JGI-2019a]|nr:hypothetical protein FRB95_000469 [Tulasnella sp. JGI-2019a]
MDLVSNKLFKFTWTSAAPPTISLLIALSLAFNGATFCASVVFLFMSGKLYCLAFLITQNQRASLREALSSNMRGGGRVSLHEEDLRRMGIIGPPKIASDAMGTQKTFSTIAISVSRSRSKAENDCRTHTLNRLSTISYPQRMGLWGRNESRGPEWPDESTIEVTTNTRVDELEHGPDESSSLEIRSSTSTILLNEVLEGERSVGERGNMQTLIQALKEDPPSSRDDWTARLPQIPPRMHGRLELARYSGRSVELVIGDGAGGFSHHIA